MALMPQRQIYQVSTDFARPFSGERGGVLSFASFSGIIMATYATEPSGLRPLGIQMFDVEDLDLSREFHPGYRGVREVQQPGDLMLALTEGEIITNFIDPNITDISIGAPAYVAPSGLITNLTTYGTQKIGYFLSTVNSSYYGLNHYPTERVLILGGGLSIQLPTNKNTVIILNPDRVYTNVKGWAKLRISV